MRLFLSFDYNNMAKRIRNLSTILLIGIFTFLSCCIFIKFAKAEIKGITGIWDQNSEEIKSACGQDKKCMADLIVTKCAQHYDNYGKCYAENFYKPNYGEEVCDYIKDGQDTQGIKNACYDYFARAFSNSDICLKMVKIKNDASQKSCIEASDKNFYKTKLPELIQQGTDRKNLITVCKKIKLAYMRGNCFLDIVDEFNDVQLCNLLFSPECGPNKETADNYFQENVACYELDNFYGTCFVHIAKNTNNGKICEQAKNFKEQCYQKVAGDYEDSVYFRSRVRILGIILSVIIFSFFAVSLIFFYKNIKKRKTKEWVYLWTAIIVILLYLGVIAYNYLFAENVHKNVLVFSMFSSFAFLGLFLPVVNPIFFLDLFLDLFLPIDISQDVSGLYTAQGVIFLHVLIILGGGLIFSKIHQKLNKKKKVLLLLGVGFLIIITIIISYLVFAYLIHFAGQMN